MLFGAVFMIEIMAIITKIKLKRNHSHPADRDIILPSCKGDNIVGQYQLKIS